MHTLLILISMKTLLAGCGATGPVSFESLVALQPRVVSVEPADGAETAGDFGVTVEFNRPIDINSVDRISFAVVKAEGAPLDDIEDDLEDGHVDAMEGIYEFAGDRRAAIFRAAGQYEPGGEYIVVATGRIRSEEGLPLNQSAGGSPEPFISAFWISGGVSGAPGGSSSPEAGGGVKERVRPDSLVINEILYDAVGSDSNGDVFVELYGEPGGDITDYELVFVNGPDGVIKDTIEMPEDALIGDDGIYLVADAVTGSPGVSHLEGADYIKNFDPQNGPDCVQLVDHEGKLLDAVGYGEPIVELAENGLPCSEGTPADDVASGVSLSRIQGVDVDMNGGDFIPMDPPTPGEL